MFYIPKAARKAARLFHSADITELMPECLARDLSRESLRKTRQQAVAERSAADRA
ncbi:hypothetical protein KHP62_07275 [Rhodobacteraceae bacterium NNCM2]|nr:hypothetical protein [Coraliihabitans acroporae]